VELSFSGVYLGDSMGDIVPAFAQGGTITVVPIGAMEMNVGDANINMGESGSFNISLANDIEVAGFQFNISIDPEIAEIVEAR